MERYIVMATKNGIDYRASQLLTSYKDASNICQTRALLDTDGEYTWRVQII